MIRATLQRLRSRAGLAVAGVVAALSLLVVAGGALAHVERTSYWPNPAPDRSVNPAAGGRVPPAHLLRTALDRRRGVRLLVVCQPDSLRRALAEIDRGRAIGYRLRPTERRRHLNGPGVWLMRRLNHAFFARCAYDEIQPAVNAADNNDRVVIMPGVYTEPSSRREPDHPKRCAKYTESSDHGAGAVSYTYQYHCPNAQSLVAVIGRAVRPGPDPSSGPTGRPDPHGIPNLGRCIRCNLQIEGSGPSPDDVVIDAGRAASGNGAPLGSKKDVGLKVDRADGFVLRNLTVRHAAEHDVYILETDGYLMERMKYFYAGEYGVLMFTTDHGVTQECEGAGNGDSAVYPGGAPDTGAQYDGHFYPRRRLNQEIRRCDLHHNNLGYSGTMGNATHVVNNNFYDNTTGIATDSFYAGGHPGYPQDSAVFERNRIYSNNFDIYSASSDIHSVTPVPIGVGIFIAGGNYDVVRRNHIYDNWRRGTMLIAVPDALSCAPNPDTGTPPCAPGAESTSNGNRYYGNVMGRTPAGTRKPNGVDFWWDEYAGNKGNCWYGNVGSNGKADGVTSDPDPAPAPLRGTPMPGFLPEANCDAPTNKGKGNAQKEAVLAACAADFTSGNYETSVCDWFRRPDRPGSSAAAAQRKRDRARPSGVAGPTRIRPFCRLLGGAGGTLTCRPFRHRP